MTAGVTYTLTSEPYYDSYTQCYINAIVINMLPEGPLRKFVQRKKFPVLSPFTSTTSSNCCQTNHCKLVLVCGEKIMTPDDIPQLFSFLTSHRYYIETKLTEMLTISPVKMNHGQILCMVTYYGESGDAPNITYMR